LFWGKGHCNRVVVQPPKTSEGKREILVWGWGGEKERTRIRWLLETQGSVRLRGGASRTCSRQQGEKEEGEKGGQIAVGQNHRAFGRGITNNTFRREDRNQGGANQDNQKN